MEKETKKDKDQRVKLWFEDRVGDPVQFREGIIRKIENGFVFLETREEITRYVKPKNPDGEAYCNSYEGTGKFKIKLEMISASRIIRMEAVE